MWIIPSRGRPAACQSLLNSMVSHGMIGHGAVITDADDDALMEYQHIRYPDGWIHLVIPHGTPGIAESIRVAFENHPTEPWYGLIADDNSVETDGFEAALVTAAGPWGIASANDLWQAREDVSKGRMHGATVFGGYLLRALGYWSPEGFKHLYLDDVWEAIGRSLGNWQTLMDVVTPHNHPFKTGETADATAARANSSDMAEHDCAAFIAWRDGPAASDVMRARTAIWASKGLDLNFARQRSVFFAVPAYRDISPYHYASMLKTKSLLDSLGIRHDLGLICGIPVTDARNVLANRLLETNFSDLLFIDADEGWEPWDVVRLLATCLPFVGAVGRKKSPAPDSDLGSWCFLPLDNGGTVPITAAGMVEVDAVGTGMLLVNRGVFEEMREAHPEWARDGIGASGNEAFTEFFACDLDDTGTRRTGEDISFCRRWRALGGTVFIDPTIAISHYGTHEYGGSVARFFDHPAIK